MRWRPNFSWVMQRRFCWFTKAMVCRHTARPSYTYTRLVSVVPEVQMAMRSAQVGVKRSLNAPSVSSLGVRWAYSGSPSRRWPRIRAVAPAWVIRWRTPSSGSMGSSSKGLRPAASSAQNSTGQFTWVSRHRPTQPSFSPRAAS